MFKHIKIRSYEIGLHVPRPRVQAACSSRAATGCSTCWAR